MNSACQMSGDSRLPLTFFILRESPEVVLLDVSREQPGEQLPSMPSKMRSWKGKRGLLSPSHQMRMLKYHLSEVSLLMINDSIKGTHRVNIDHFL